MTVAVKAATNRGSMLNNNNNKGRTMTREEMEAIALRYEQYCYCLISIAGQVKHIEDEHDMDLSDTQDVMWGFLEQLITNKPNWLQ